MTSNVLEWVNVYLMLAVSYKLRKHVIRYLDATSIVL